MRSRSARILFGLIIGALVGLAIFYARQLQGPGLFLLTGAAGGAVAAVVEHGYRRSAQLAEVTVSVPQLSELRFVVTKDTCRVAWKLFVETVTRVSTQPLPDDGGLLREAMNSIYGLFQVTRETLKDTMPSSPRGTAPTVEQLAITMLNLELRPFLSRWHPALQRWKQENPDADERAWPDNTTCRRDLAQVQQRLHEYAHGYAQLAGVDNAAALLTDPPPARPPKQRAVADHNPA